MRPLLIALMLCLPAAALAEDAAQTTADDKTPAVATPTPPAPSSLSPSEQLLNAFPDWATTKAGAATTGQPQPQLNKPADAAAAPLPAGASPAPAAPAPAVPASPTRPDKLWPKDTVPVFLQSCTGYHHELLAPCSCVITHLMSTMPHDEFMAESADNSLAKDTRYVGIRQHCLGTPNQHPQAPVIPNASTPPVTDVH